MEKLEKVINLFSTSGKTIYCGRYGQGHINETYLLVDENARQYILQKINHNVFKNPPALMYNIAGVLKHLKEKDPTPRTAMALVPTKDGGTFLHHDNGTFWRMYEFVSDTICLNKTPSKEEFAESARAFGNFQQLLSDFDAANLNETIPNFHHTVKRYENFKKALDANSMERAKNIKLEIDFVLKREEYAPTLTKLLENGDLPLRVTHNDTKLNNVLLDRHTKKAICVIDLDTVMPGLLVNDFGDSIRFGASTATEDEQDLSKVSLSEELYEAYADAFISACGSKITEVERDCLFDGAKMMTLECGVRFLTDYLEGDHYFATKRPEHNLDRARTQFALVKDMEKKESVLRHFADKA